MQGLKSWIQNNDKAIRSAGPVIISLIAGFVLIILISKAVWAMRAGKGSEAVKHIGFAIGVVLLALVGIAGLSSLVEKIAPSNSILPRG